MEATDFRSSLKRALEQKNWTQEILAEEVGITGRHLSRVATGKATLTRDLLEKIAAALEKPVSYFTGEVSLAEDYFPVPFRDAGGGMGGGVVASSRKIISYISLRRDFLLTKTNNLEALSFINALGESMFPTIPPDALVLIDESQVEPVNGKIFYVMWNNNFLIKRLEVKNGKVTAMLSDNGEHREALGEQDSLQILGRAILQQTML